jgi:AraC-like DNA-binding protein
LLDRGYGFQPADAEFADRRDDGGVMQVHSVQVDPGPCATIISLPQPRLRPYVVGYAGFRARPEGALRRRLLPLNLTTMIIDFAGPGRLVTGPRSTPAVFEEAAWRHGVAVGLTPAGVSALLRMPMSELAGTTAPLPDLLGRRAVRLADRLGESPDWATRFALLDERLAAWLVPDRGPDGLVMRAWWRLQEPSDRITIGELADELGISRRYLEVGFQKQIGLAPKAVARVARFQHAVHMLGKPTATLKMAAASGYADQPHFNREIRAMTGITPTELFAFLQYNDHLTD